MQAKRPDTAKTETRSNVHLREAAGEGILYDMERKTIHVLNVTALEVWKLCRDRRATPKEITDRLSRRYGVSRDEVEDDVQQILDEFDHHGLLRPIPASGAAAVNDRSEVRP